METAFFTYKIRVLCILTFFFFKCNVWFLDAFCVLCELYVSRQVICKYGGCQHIINYEKATRQQRYCRSSCIYTHTHTPLRQFLVIHLYTNRQSLGIFFKGFILLLFCFVFLILTVPGLVLNHLSPLVY